VQSLLFGVELGVGTFEDDLRRANSRAKSLKERFFGITSVLHRSTLSGSPVVSFGRYVRESELTFETGDGRCLKASGS
jgi:hypothetical protein